MGSLLVLLVTVGQPPGDRGPGADPDRGTATAGGRAEGAWAVVAAERAGRPLAARTATVRDGTLTFDVARDTPATDGGANRPGGGAGGSDTLPPLRLDFAPAGTVRVSEVATGGRAAGPTGAAAGVVRPGVYVMTRDYLAISVLPAPAAGAAPGAARDAGSIANGGASGDAARPYLTLILRRPAGGR